MRHRFHALCPYFAMFPETFAEYWIEELTRPGDLVLDPFCGRGTTPLQALLLDRWAIGNDINPVASCLSRAKTGAPRAQDVRARLTVLQGQFHAEGHFADADHLPEFFHVAFAPRTLEQLCFLRQRLRWRTSRVDCMVAALVLGALHGESERSQRYLSNQMPRTISTKPAYSIRYWRERGLLPPDRDVFAVIDQAVAYRYGSPAPPKRGTIFEGDFRSLPARLGRPTPPVKLVVTSPPYFDTTRYEEDQWLRLWFLGHKPFPTYSQISRDDRHGGEGVYWSMISDLWRVLGSILAKRAYVVIRLGGRGVSAQSVRQRLEAATAFSPREFELVATSESQAKRRQTDAFRPGTKAPLKEVDCCFVAI